MSSNLALDVVTLGVSQVQAAESFYVSVFAPTVTHTAPVPRLDMHPAGQIALRRMDELTTETGGEFAAAGFPGYTLNYTVQQPSEVVALLEAAVQNGATVLKAAKGSLFGGFSAVFQAPDQTVWKLAAPTRKDTGPAGMPPRPSEMIAILGVASPKASKSFYTALGMSVDRDYGNKFIDFRLSPGTWRLGLMPRKSLASDAGVKDRASGCGGAVFTHQVASSGQVDSLLQAVAAAGGEILSQPQATAQGGYVGHFRDPDGFVWRAVSA